MRSRALLLCVLLSLVAGFSSGSLGDPTEPPPRPPTAAERAEDAPTLSLWSIVISPSDRFAVIDGVRVRIGDAIGSARVVGIDLSGVRLLGPDGEILLNVSGGAFKRPSLGDWSAR